jgi:nucleoid-associated protein YgaU
MTVGQYDGGNYRGESPEPRHPRHSAPTPRYNDAPRRDDGKYEVQPNDSYWTISEKLYGTGAYFKALAQHNRGKQWDDDRLQPGVLILAPAVAELEKSYPDLCPKPSRREALQSQAMSRASMVSGRNQSRGGRTYTVAEGDTLFNIARYELGKASRWAEIYDLNREVLGKDFNYLTPGTQLAMPEGEKSDVIAQPLESGYRR